MKSSTGTSNEAIKPVLTFRHCPWFTADPWLAHDVIGGHVGVLAKKSFANLARELRFPFLLYTNMAVQY